MRLIVGYFLRGRSAGKGYGPGLFHECSRHCTGRATISPAVRRPSTQTLGTHAGKRDIGMAWKPPGAGHGEDALSDQIAWLENAAEDDKADAGESGEAERERQSWRPLRAA
jgi:hypothetical protein